MNSMKDVLLLLSFFFLVKISIGSDPLKALDKYSASYEFPPQDEIYKCGNSLDFSACENFTKYPSDSEMNKLYDDKKVKVSWFDKWCNTKNPKYEITPKISEIDGGNLCQISVDGTYRKPKGIVVNNTFYYVVQIPGRNCFQHINVGMCNTTKKENGQPESNQICDAKGRDLSSVLEKNAFLENYQYNCVQKWNNYTSLTVTKKPGEVEHIYINKPSYCVCEYKKK